jgi:hypothetical protein
VDESDDEGGHVSGVDTDREDWVGQVQCVVRSVYVVSLSWTGKSSLSADLCNK